MSALLNRKRTARPKTLVLGLRASGSPGACRPWPEPSTQIVGPMPARRSEDSDARVRQIHGTTVAAVPVMLGPRNAAVVTGFPWRWCRDTAKALGVPMIGYGRKRGIRPDAFLAALESSNRNRPAAEDPMSGAELAARLRQALGKVRVSR